MAGNDQDISQMTSVPTPLGEGGDNIGFTPENTPMGNPSPPMGGLSALSAPAAMPQSVSPAAPPTAQSAFTTPPNQNQSYLDQISAIQNEIKNQTNSSQVPWFQLAAAFLNPGRTGSFGESLGGAAGAMGKYQAEQQAQKLPLMQAGLKAEELRQGIVKEQSVKDLMGKLYEPVKDEAGNISTYKFNPEVAQQLVQATGDPKIVALLNEETQKQTLQHAKNNLFQMPDGSAGFNPDAFKKLYAIDSKEALETVKQIPEMRRFGLLPSTGAEDTPFDVLALMAKDPIIKAEATRAAHAFRTGGMSATDAEKKAEQLMKLQQEGKSAEERLQESKIQHGIMNELARARAEESKRMHDYTIGQATEKKENALASQEQLLKNLQNQVSTVRHSPGRGAATLPVAGPFISMLPATDAREFANQMQTLKSQQFLNNIQGMKGMGSLSNAEGEKVMNLITSLDPQMSKPAFDRALDQIDKFVSNGLQNIERQRSGQAPKFIESDKPANESKTIDFHDLPKKAK